jgi:hypothetical protein
MTRRAFFEMLGAAGLALGGASLWRLQANHVLAVTEGPA